MGVLHPARMQPYLEATQHNEMHALALYQWHTELAAAVQQILGITEIVLRNAMDARLQWWNRANGGMSDSWLLSPPVPPLRSLIERKRVSALRAASHNALRRGPGHQRYGQKVQHNDVLAQVMFGMWKDLLPNQTAGASLTSIKNLNRDRLWDEALREAFPHISDSDGSITFWRVADLHRLRNRVSHMEPLLDENLQSLMRQAFSLMKSIEPAVEAWVTGFNRVPDVLRARPY